MTERPTVPREADTAWHALSRDVALERLGVHVALLVPLVAGLIGLLNSFRMVRLPDVAPSAAVEGLAFG